MTLKQAVLGFTAVAAVLTVIPGMDTTLVLRASLVEGRRRAALTAAGVLLGVFVWGAAAALGAAALLAASELAFRIVTLAGAAYMISLGARMLLGALRGGAGAPEPTVTAPRSGWTALATGFTTNLLNPKIGVFYIATIPQFLPEGVPALPMGLLLAGIHALLGAVWFTLVILASTYARRALSGARGPRIVDAIAGSVLMAMGARLALAHR